MTVRAQTNLVKRGSVFYFRKKVPKDLQVHFGTESIRKSLAAFTTQADAKAEAIRLAAHYDDQFRSLQRLYKAPAVALTKDLVPQIASALEAHILRADEEVRAEGMSEEAFDESVALMQAEEGASRRSYARGDSSDISHQLSDWLWGLGLDENPDPEVLGLLRRKFQEARLRALIAKSGRNAGDIIPAPEAPSPEELRMAIAVPEAAAVQTYASVDAKAPKLKDLLDYWKGAKEKTPRTVQKAELVVRTFIELHGDLPLLSIQKSHFVVLRDHLLDTIKPATVQSQFNLVKAAFTVALEDDKFELKANPMQFVKIRKGEDDEDEGADAFSADDLQVLFDSPVFTQGFRMLGGAEEAAFWAPLIALFTGARREEIISLRADGLYEREGVWVFHFRHRPSLGQYLKGKTKNNRRVPIHPELIRLGILEYLDSVKEPGPWLFPAVDRSEKKRAYSSAFGAWFGRYLDKVGLTNERLVFHSFRHTFKHFARASGIREDQQDAMTGHQNGEVARSYGSGEGYPVGALKDAMAQLRFGSLDLTGVISAGADGAVVSQARGGDALPENPNTAGVPGQAE